MAVTPGACGQRMYPLQVQSRAALLVRAAAHTLGREPPCAVRDIAPPRAAKSCESPMDLDLGGKLALITGGSRGIGRAVGEALAAEGCRLVLVSRRAADLDIARTQIEGRYNVSVRTDAADLGDSTNVARLARLFPDVDILVNNAGAPRPGT